jgi:hypothetical protein
MGQKVKNITAFSENSSTSKHYNWIKYWENFSGSKRGICAVEGCLNDDVHGAHVQKVDENDTWYISNFCASHNVAYVNAELELKEGARLVLARCDFNLKTS